jgi:TetR/AcrR family transcriptional repressor of nem operon
MSNLTSKAEEIVASTKALIIAGGYNGFSYADVSEQVGIRKASIHHHFPNKVDLVQTVVASYRDEVLDGLAALEQGSPDPAVQLMDYVELMRACIEDGSRPFCLCGMLAAEMPVLPPEIVHEVRAYFVALSGWLCSVLQRGAAIDKIRLTGPAATEAELLVATVYGAMLLARARGDASVFAAIVQPLLHKLIIRR